MHFGARSPLLPHPGLGMSDLKVKERALLEALVAWGRGKSEPSVAQAVLI